MYPTEPTWKDGSPMKPTSQLPIIDADELQKKQSAPYQYHGMTIQEVPIGNPVRVDIFKKVNPCGAICGDYQRGDCPGEIWVCKEYREFRSE